MLRSPPLQLQIEDGAPLGRVGQVEQKDLIETALAQQFAGQPLHAVGGGHHEHGAALLRHPGEQAGQHPLAGAAVAAAVALSDEVPWYWVSAVNPIGMSSGLLAPLHRQIEADRRQFQYGGANVTRTLRDEIGQGFSIALLAGFRGIVADFLWIKGDDCWKERAWVKQSEYIENAVKLQPRSTYFWDAGAWHMGWNIAYAERVGTNDVPIAQALTRERYWHQRARALLERGIQNLPNRFDLYYKLGFLYDQKLVRDCGGDEACRQERYAKAAEIGRAHV